MPISGPQIPDALSTIGQMITTLNTIVSLLNEAEILIGKNWIITLAPGVTLPIPSDQQTALVSQYDTLKATLASQYGQLP